MIGFCIGRLLVAALPVGLLLAACNGHDLPSSDAGAKGDDAAGADAPGDGSCDRPSPSGEAQVPTSSGVVEGEESTAGFAFRGIPYAATPVGELRFRPPEKPSCWSDVRPARDFGSKCPQLDSNGAFVGDEDCLTLNVFSPTPEEEADLPVLVFLHGGFNVRGSSDYEVGDVLAYEGSELARRGPAVVVTANYRLGALGFLAHSELAKGEEEPLGNYALRDQIAALEWIQENIGAFGGDPDRVLLFGQSAGSIDTCALLASPAASGLFDRAMMLSGACVALAQEEAEAIGDLLIEQLGCADSEDVGGCLRSDVSQEEIIQATFGPSSSTDGAYPTVDEAFLPKRPDEVFADGEGVDVPVVVSTTAEEFTILASALMENPLDSEDKYRAAIDMLFDEDDPTMEQIRRLELVGEEGPIANDVLEAYPYDDYSSGNDAVVALLSDLFYVCPARRTLDALSDGGRAAHRAVFTGSMSSGPLEPFGAAHGFDVLFGFRTLTAFGHEPTDEELELADAMGGAWVRFAGTGDPGGDGLSWPSYPSHVELGFPVRDGTGFRESTCDFWDSLR